MKKALFSLFLVSVSALASDENATQLLLNSITVCPASVNPLRALAKLRGNSFTDARFVQGSSGPILVQAVYDPQLLNPLIMAPSRLVGTVRVEMAYPPPGYALRCRVSASSRP